MFSSRIRGSRADGRWATISILKQITADNIDTVCFGMLGIAFRTPPPTGGLSCFLLIFYVATGIVCMSNTENDITYM